MGTGYFVRASLIATYILTLGGIPLLSQANPQQHVKPQILERRITEQQSQQVSLNIPSLHHQLLKRIDTLENELLLESTPKRHLGDNDICDTLGYMLYDDLAKVASRFNRKIRLGGLCVYRVDDGIIVDNKIRSDVPSYRLVFYPNDTAVEVPYLQSINDYLNSIDGDRKFEAIGIKVTKIKGKEVVEEKPIESNWLFSYAPDMNGYDFSLVHSRVSVLNYAFKRLRKATPPEGLADSKDERLLYKMHPADAPKFSYIEDQFKLIAAGLFNRYGFNLREWDLDQYGDRPGEYTIVDTVKGVIRVFAVRARTSYSPGLVRTLIVKDMPRAELTTTLVWNNWTEDPEFSFVFPSPIK